MDFEAFVEDARAAAAADSHLGAILVPRFLEDEESMRTVRDMWDASPFLRMGLCSLAKMVGAVLEAERKRTGKSPLRPLRRAVDPGTDAQFVALMAKHTHWPEEHALTAMARNIASDDASREALRAIYHRAGLFRGATDAFAGLLDGHMRG